MTENLVSKVLKTTARAVIAAGALYTVSCLNIGRETIRDVGYSIPGCGNSAYIIDKHIYEKPDLITLAAILGTAVALRKSLREKK